MSGKFIIYQLFVRLFGNRNDYCIPNGSLKENGSGKFNDITEEVINDIKKLGVSHIWLTGVIRHATKSDFSRYGIEPVSPSLVKGEAGSPYAIVDYYDVSPELSVSVEKRMEEFEALIKRCKESGVSVIIDFVPNHISREYHSLNGPSFGEDNFYYLPGEELVIGEYHEYPARATGNDLFSASPGLHDWYETVKLNYGVDIQNGGAACFDPIPDTWWKMSDILLFWRSRGVAGFRCDMAEMVPAEFWKWAIGRIKSHYPETIFIAEIYNKQRYRDFVDAGFDYLYDKVGLYDTLIGILKGEKSAERITEAWKEVEGIQDRLLNFLENHDEQRVASDFICGNGEAAIPALVISLLLNKAPFMLYNGQELGERGMDSEGFSGLDGRTTIYDYWSMSSVRNFLKGRDAGSESSLYSAYKELLFKAVNEDIFRYGETYDINYANYFSTDYNPELHFSFLRVYNGEVALVVANFDKKPAYLTINIPKEAFSHYNLNRPEQRISIFVDKYVIISL